VSFTFYERQLGLTLMGIDETGYRPAGDTPCAYIMVTNVQKMSEAAAQATTLKGLAVRAVEGRPMHGLSFNATANEIRQAPRPISVTFGPPPLSADEAALEVRCFWQHVSPGPGSHVHKCGDGRPSSGDSLTRISGARIRRRGRRRRRRGHRLRRRRRRRPRRAKHAGRRSAKRR
jgi:hypothetical protein